MSVKRKAVAVPVRTKEMRASKFQPTKSTQMQAGQCVEDYIWAAMQGYAADIRSGRLPERRYV